MDTNYTIQLIVSLNELYPEYRFEHNPDWLSFEYVEIENIEMMKQELEDFFINWSWYSSDIWEGRDLVWQDYLHRTMEAFRQISKIDVSEEHHLVSFKYNFLCDLDRLYAAYDMLHEENNNQFETLFPEIADKTLNMEIDKIRLIKFFVSRLVKITDDSKEVETV